MKQGVDELDAEQLSPLLRLRYQALSDAFAELGKTKCGRCWWGSAAAVFRLVGHSPVSQIV